MSNADRNITNYTDEELMSMVLERNTKGLKVLYDRYYRSIFNFILRYTNNREISEDILQETFTRVWFASHLFNPDKGSFKTWLFTIGINITRNEMTKKRYNYKYIEMDEITEQSEIYGKSEDEPLGDILEHSDLKDTIAKALERLNPFLREVVILKHYQMLKFSEISEITNTPEGTLKARFHNAVIQLRKLLQTAEF
jgi:RNA polymerase sigma-70 factor (ECF subfamily)